MFAMAMAGRFFQVSINLTAFFQCIAGPLREGYLGSELTDGKIMKILLKYSNL